MSVANEPTVRREARRVPTWIKSVVVDLLGASIHELRGPLNAMQGWTQVLDLAM
jgi:hypothetical protein